MRPVDRGAAPRAYRDYNLALGDLHERIGRHCSYCERPYAGAVEHVLPKGVHKGLRNDWGNFLVACPNCNSIKNVHQKPGTARTHRAARRRYLWPDVDNTARAFIYSRAGVAVAPGLGPHATALANATMKLTGFHRTPKSADPPKSKKDLRWKERAEAWDIAERMKKLLLSNPCPEQVESIGLVARGTGFWSVWREVFSGQPDVLGEINRLCRADVKCFDPVTLAPTPRSGGQL